MILFVGEVHLGTPLTILSKEKDKTSEGRSVCLTYDWLRLSGHGNSNQAEVILGHRIQEISALNTVVCVDKSSTLPILASSMDGFVRKSFVCIHCD